MIVRALRVGFAHGAKPDSRDRGGARPRACVLRRTRPGAGCSARRRTRRDDACTEAQAGGYPDHRTEHLRVDVLVVELDLLLAARLDVVELDPRDLSGSSCGCRAAAGSRKGTSRGKGEGCREGETGT